MAEEDETRNAKSSKKMKQQNERRADETKCVITMPLPQLSNRMKKKEERVDKYRKVKSKSRQMKQKEEKMDEIRTFVGFQMIQKEEKMDENRNVKGQSKQTKQKEKRVDESKNVKVKSKQTKQKEERVDGTRKKAWPRIVNRKEGSKRLEIQEKSSNTENNGYIRHTVDDFDGMKKIEIFLDELLPEVQNECLVCVPISVCGLLCCAWFL